MEEINKMAKKILTLLTLLFLIDLFYANHMLKAGALPNSDFAPYFNYNKTTESYINAFLFQYANDTELQNAFIKWRDKQVEATKPKPNPNPPPPTVQHKEYKPIEGKIAYITFDDGPDKTVTPMVLDILKEENIKATFFVLGGSVQSNPDLLKRAYSEGHSIGNHTYSHNYNTLYKTPEGFWKDFKQAEDVINNTIGIIPIIYRCPSGSFPRFTENFRTYMNDKGYTFYDWNIDSTDSKRVNVPVSTIENSTLEEISQLDKPNAKLMILLHDGTGHKNSALSLHKIIQELKDRGYTFQTVTPETEPIQFHVKK
jgi:peptidoglycan/xylan/chitin deacetylase (PgdA/CDA1 family)